MTKRLYIAGPMTGLPEFNYPAFMEAEKRLNDMGYKVENPARIDDMFLAQCRWNHDKGCYNGQPACGECRSCKERDWVWYMRKATVMLVQSDGVALLDRWWESRGAWIEADLARQLNMEIRPLDEWKGHW